MVQLLDVEVTLWKSLESTADELSIGLSERTVVDESGAKRVPDRVGSELDLAIADGLLEFHDEEGLHDDVDSAQAVGHEAEVPIGPSVREFILPDHLEY